jgi:hypothetical protein
MAAVGVEQYVLLHGQAVAAVAAHSAVAADPVATTTNQVAAAHWPI